MNEDYTQSFYVPPKMAKRLGWSCAGYLPPLKPRPLIEHTLPIEHTPQPPEQVDYLRGCIAYLQNRLTELEKTKHTHSYKKEENYIIKE